MVESDEISNENGAIKITIGEKVIYVTDSDPYSHIAIGDIVYYDPTAGVSNPATNPLLRYTSPKGSSVADGDGSNSPGNGQQDQTFKATSSDCKWVVLYKKDGQLVLMSYDLKNPTQNAYNGYFGMRGATAYLYAEQELHNICSIYGHRKRCSK